MEGLDPLVVGALSIAGMAALITGMLRMKSFFQADIPKKIEKNTDKIEELDRRVSSIETIYKAEVNSFNSSLAGLQKSIDEGHLRSSQAHQELREAISELRKEFAEIAKENKQHEADRRKDIYSRLDRLEGR